MSTEKEKPIEGQKAIAAHIGMSERALRDWIQDPKKGLPVWRFEGRYFAYASALDLWKSTRTVHGSVRLAG